MYRSIAVSAALNLVTTKTRHDVIGLLYEAISSTKRSNGCYISYILDRIRGRSLCVRTAICLASAVPCFDLHVYAVTVADLLAMIRDVRILIF